MLLFAVAGCRAGSTSVGESRDAANDEAGLVQVTDASVDAAYRDCPAGGGDERFGPELRAKGWFQRKALEGFIGPDAHCHEVAGTTLLVACIDGPADNERTTIIGRDGKGFRLFGDFRSQVAPTANVSWVATADGEGRLVPPPAIRLALKIRGATVIVEEVSCARCADTLRHIDDTLARPPWRERDRADRWAQWNAWHRWKVDYGYLCAAVGEAKS